MNNVDYKAMLYEKMNNEQNSYRKWLLSQPPAEILNHTYEYTTREDILMCMEELSLQPKQAKAMLKSPCPLKDVYEESEIVKRTIWTRFESPSKQKRIDVSTKRSSGLHERIDEIYGRHVYENIRKRSIQRYAQRFPRSYEYRGNVFGFEHQ